MDLTCVFNAYGLSVPCFLKIRDPVVRLCIKSFNTRIELRSALFMGPTFLFLIGLAGKDS